MSRCQGSPASQQLLSTCTNFGRQGSRIHLQLAGQKLHHALLLQQQWNVVSGVDITNGNHLLWANMAEHADFLDSCNLQFFRTTTGNHVWSQSQQTQVLDGGLSWLCLLFTMDHQNERNVNQRKVVHAHTELELTQCLDEWSTFDVTHSSTQFNDTNLWFLAQLVHRNSSNTLDPALNGVGHMWNHLDCFTQVVSLTFSFNHMRVDFTRGDVVVTRQSDVEISFVVTQIQINFTSVIQDKTLTMLERRHSSRVNVHVRVDFDGSDSVTQGFKKQTGGGGQNALSDSGNDSSRNNNVFHDLFVFCLREMLLATLH